MGKERGSYGQLAASGALQPDYRLALTARERLSTAGDQYEARENVDAVFATVVCAADRQLQTQVQRKA